MSKSFEKLLFFIVLTLGILGQLLIISPSGNRINGDILFWSSHAHDSMWHIAVSNEIAKGFPIQNPVFAGEKLVNYHIFSDVFPTLLNTALKIPSLTVYFWIMPIIYSVLLGCVAYLVGKEIGKSSLTGIFSMFSVYFIGSFGYIVTLIRDGELGGESIFWASQIQSSVGNPPQILSNILFLGFIYLLIKYLNNNSLPKLPLVLLLVATSASKIYAGMVILPAIGALAIYRFVKSKKSDLVFVTIISAFASLLVYLPSTKSAGGYLIFEPLWLVRKIFSDPKRIGIPNFDLIVQHYQSLGTLKSNLGFAKYDIIGLIIILIGNLGMRVFGVLAIPKIFKRGVEISVFLLSTIIISFLIPNLFLQKGVAANTSQTFQYMLLVFGVYFALFVSSLFSKIHKNSVKLLFIIILIALSIPTQIGLIREFYSRSPHAVISSQELKALSFLKTILTKSDIILTPSYDPYLDTKKVPPPIWDWFDTSYVSAMTGGRVYFADYEQVDIMGYDYRSRKEVQDTIFNENSIDKIMKAIHETGADYIYYPTKQKPKTAFSTINKLSKVFENAEVEIWKVN